METVDTIEKIQNDIRNCTKCPLCRSRTQAVPGEGPETATILLVGEGAGFYEDQQGRPFVGPSGKLLDQLLEYGGLKREDIFVTNMVCCRPPDNRDPTQQEIDTCSSYLDRFIAVLQPTIIGTLGRYAMERFYGKGEKISRVHGKARLLNDRVIVPLFHPAYILRNRAAEKLAIIDFRLLQRSAESRTNQPVSVKIEKVEQLKLF